MRRRPSPAAIVTAALAVVMLVLGCAMEPTDHPPPAPAASPEGEGAVRVRTRPDEIAAQVRG